jgi:hypothetical protein
VREIGHGRVFVQSDEEIVASVFSLSSAAPYLFGKRLGDFEADRRQMLRGVSPAGRFAERAREIELVIWMR